MINNLFTSMVLLGQKRAAFIVFIVVALTLALLLIPQLSTFACGGPSSCPCPGC